MLIGINVRIDCFIIPVVCDEVSPIDLIGIEKHKQVSFIK
jgi:hypothetical protein